MAAYRKRYVRAEPEHPLTPRKVAVLRAVAECGMLTVPQVAVLCGLSPRAARDHCRDLFHLGLLDRCATTRASVAPPEVGDGHELLHGSAPPIHRLSKAGAKELGIALPALPAYGPRNALFLAHELAVRDVRCWLAGVLRKHPHHTLERWEWGAAARLPPARPDAWFAYRVGERGFAGLVEVDRGTERGAARWAGKVADYAAFFGGGPGAVKAAVGWQGARVLAIAPDAARRDAILKVVEAELPKHALPPERFWAAAKGELGEELGVAVWRCAGKTGLWPLIPQERL